MAGWDSVWDTDQKVNVEIAPGDVRPVSILGVAVFDSPAFYSGELVINLKDLFGSEDDFLELWSRGKNLTQRELNSGMSVRDMDGGDVVDRIGMDAPLMKWAGKTIPFKLLQKMFAAQNYGEQLPGVQRQLSLETMQSKLVSCLVEDDRLSKFFTDTIYSVAKDEIGRDEASDIAAKLGPVYAAAVEKLGVKYTDVVGGSANNVGFAIDLRDGRSVQGDANGANFS